jgi:hypothetical protein
MQVALADTKFYDLHSLSHAEDDNIQDSDEEALEDHERTTHSNIVQSDLVLQEGVDVYIVEAKSKKRIKLSLGQDNVTCAVCGQRGAIHMATGTLHNDCNCQIPNVVMCMDLESDSLAI